MLSLYVRPITFDNKKNEILQSNFNIEWKKQVSTVSIKKGLSAIDFLNQKINNKIFGYEIAIKENTPSVFAYFDYIEEDNRKKQIFLVNNTNINENNQSYTNLYYKSHIPEKESINIVINNKDVIKKHKDYLKITGQVLAFCIDINTYYLENININEYVEFVQNNDYDADDVDDNFADSDIDSNADSDTNITPQENSDSENTDASDNESNDSNDSKNNSDVDNDYSDVSDIDNNELGEDDSDVDSDVDNEDENELNIDEDAPTEINTDEEDNEDNLNEVEDGEDSEEDGEEDGEEDDNLEAEVDEFEEGVDGPDLIEIIPEVEQNTKRNKTKHNKNVKLSSNIDLSIIFNILNPEDKNKITPEKELHPKRNVNLQILKTLPLPLKTIQLIEKGIYNYSIDKCNNKSFIPLWDNMEFAEIYISKTKNIYTNLNSKCYVKNKQLIENIKSGKIEPYELAFLDTYKLFPEIWNDIIEEKTKIEKILKDSLKESATDMFECPKCHKRKTIYCEVQTRSSDEPMTKFITCLECGCKWKKY